MTDIKTCYVRHCPNAFGVSFTDKNGRKLTYSGDTMPAASLIELGKIPQLIQTNTQNMANGIFPLSGSWVGNRQ